MLGIKAACQYGYHGYHGYEGRLTLLLKVYIYNCQVLFENETVLGAGRSCTFNIMALSQFTNMTDTEKMETAASEYSEEIIRDDLKYLTSNDMAMLEGQVTTGKTFAQYIHDHVVQHLNRAQVKRLARSLIPQDSQCNKILDSMRSHDKISLYLYQLIHQWLERLDPKPTWGDFIERLEGQHGKYSDFIKRMHSALAADNIAESTIMDDGRLVSKYVSDDEDFPVETKKEAITFAVQALGISGRRANSTVEDIDKETTDTDYYGAQLFVFWKQTLIDENALTLVDALKKIDFNAVLLREFTDFLLNQPAYKSIMLRRKNESGLADLK